MDDKNYTNVVLEDIRSHMELVVELATSTNETVSTLKNNVTALQEDVADLKSDIKIVKHAVTETNEDLKLLERRVTKLEHI